MSKTSTAGKKKIDPAGGVKYWQSRKDLPPPPPLIGPSRLLTAGDWPTNGTNGWQEMSENGRAAAAQNWPEKNGGIGCLRCRFFCEMAGQFYWVPFHFPSIPFIFDAFWAKGEIFYWSLFSKEMSSENEKKFLL